MERIKKNLKEEMKMTFLDSLYEEIENQTELLKSFDPGSKEYEAVANRIDKLMAKTIDIEKFNNEQALKQQQVENERVEKERATKDEQKDRIVRNIISAAGILLPLSVTIWGTYKTLKFEETGTVTTMMGRGFINKLLPKK